MADIITAYDAEESLDAQLDAITSYDRLTSRVASRNAAPRLFTPSRSLQVGDRHYNCTVTRDQYYEYAMVGTSDA